MHELTATSFESQLRRLTGEKVMVWVGHTFFGGIVVAVMNGFVLLTTTFEHPTDTAIDVRNITAIRVERTCQRDLTIKDD